MYDYHIKYLQYTNNIPPQSFHYLLFYMKAVTVNTVISGKLQTFHNTDAFTLNTGLIQ